MIHIVSIVVRRRGKKGGIRVTRAERIAFCASSSEVNRLVSAVRKMPLLLKSAERLIDAMGGDPPDWLRPEYDALVTATRA